MGQNLDGRSYATSSELIADETNRDALCLIFDYRMPGLDGISLLRQMRFLGWGGRAALIPAYRSPKLEAEAALTGYELIIHKPVRGQHLLNTFTRLTARPSVRPGEGVVASIRPSR